MSRIEKATHRETHTELLTVLQRIVGVCLVVFIAGVYSIECV